MSIDPTRTSLSTPADSEPPRKMASKSPGGVVEGGAEAVVVGGGDREKVRAQALKVFAKAMVFWAPEGKKALAACLGINPTREQQPTPETLKVHIEAIGSGVVLLPYFEIKLDDERTMYEIIRQALIKNGQLGPPHHCYFLQNGQKCNLDVKPADYHSEGEIKLHMLAMVDLPGKEEALAAVSQNGSALSKVGAELRVDRDVVLAAVRKDGGALQYATEELQEDREVVLAAVSNYGRALEFAAKVLRGDREVVLAAVSNCGNALKDATEGLQADKHVVLAAVNQDGWALLWAVDELRADRDVVLAAVRNYGIARAFVAEELQEDPQVIAAAGL